MNSYILLRDNKETGPHMLADLERIGLKTNDLVWIECQSVGWRHPGEIKELKHLVTEKAVSVVIEKEKEPQPVPEIEKASIPLTENHSSVFVKLPAGHNSPAQKQETDSIPEKQDYSRYQQKEEPAPVYQEKEIQSTVNTMAKVSTENAGVETKYARSLDEIKDMYVKNLQNRRKKTMFRIPKSIVRAAVYLGLIGVGAITVYFIMNADHDLPGIADESPHLRVNLQPRLDTMPPYNNPASENNSAASLEDDLAFKAEPFIPQVEKTQPERNKKNDPGPVVEENEIIDTESTLKKVNPDLTSSITRNEDPDVKHVPIASIADQVAVKTNTYTVAALGGIRNLELTVLNDSKYLVDRVTVELRYLNPSGVVLKTEDVQFSSIHPKGTQTIAVKKSNRGVKIAYKITRVESKGSAYTAGLD